ncbi:MAG: DUF4476 domain-containing protein [Bacteroidota bacterium]
MKKMYLFLLASFISLQVFSQNKLNIVVFSDDGEPFYVVINGIRQNMKAETNVRVTDLTWESLSFKIIFEDSKIPVISKTQYMPFGMEYTFRIKKDKKGNRNMKYFGEVALNESTNTGVPSVAYHATETPVTTTSTGTTGTTGTTMTTNTTGGGTGSNVSVGVSGTGTETTTTSTQTTTVITTGGTTGNTGTTTTGTNGTGTSENVNVGVNMGGVGLNMNVNVNETGTGTNTGGNVSTGVGVSGTGTGSTGTVTSGTSYSETTTTTTTTTTSYGGGTTSTGVTSTGTGTTGTTGTGTTSYSGGTTSSTGCYYPIADSDYQGIKKSIEAKSFEDSKLTLAKQVTKTNCMSAEQIKGIMALFSFEDSKLTYAKYAYDYCSDKNNYYKVNDEFDFESSIEALDKYISTKK